MSADKMAISLYGLGAHIRRRPKDAIQDQIIIAPEIMSMILEQLDIKNLKKVRLVCKSWLREAQAHIERRGILTLQENSITRSVQHFVETRETSAHTQPLRSIGLCFGEFCGSIILKWLLSEIGRLEPPLMLKRFTQGGYPLKLAIIQLINQHSSTLEYLELSLQCTTDEAAAIPALSPGTTFPNLRHLSLDTGEKQVLKSHAGGFEALISGIVNASPKLETYEYPNATSEASELASTILIGADIRNVKTLKLSQYDLTSEALLHLMSIPFWRLQNLKVILPSRPAPPLSSLALTTTLAKSATTLKTLNLLRYSAREILAEFPICPCVQELTMEEFPYLNNFLSTRFPSLLTLNISRLIVDVLDDSWADLPPLSSLRTLRTPQYVVLRDGDGSDEHILRFLSKFPNLERVRFDDLFVRQCCKIIAAGGDPQGSTNLLRSLKHLELTGYTGFWGSYKDFYSIFAALTGILSLTLVSFEPNLLRLPLQDMRSLKVIRFPWGRGCLNYERTIGKGLDKVIITNCCSFPRTGCHTLDTRALDSFLESSPNAECGCKDWRESFCPDWDLSWL